MTATIIDYGAGNLRSVQNAMDLLRADYIVTDRPEVAHRAERLIFPGVGHFGQMMQALDRLQLRTVLQERIRKGVPTLGICLGLQALLEASDEAPGQQGLGLLPGTVRRFEGEGRVPHMGWNSLEQQRPSRLLAGLHGAPYTYFANSYYVPVTPAAVAICCYLQPCTAVLEQDSLFGVQFHPEKSGPVGLQILRNFLGL